MSKKKELPRKARHGIVVSLEERPDGMLGMMMDTVKKREGSDPAEWIFQKNFVNLDHPADLMENLQLTRKELAEIGETMMIWLLSSEGRLN
ncbi:hypothetical protein [Sansalvadorimonas verongulae]|uniref:hypothetical protein n=1 Tax=Sansalvadorimonas verongulae TaxID=2172824 RepID=UPI0012BBD0FC|nr:hypothetical protein [Sansalvadorimonas verongulae]MTI14631.1 hypothetical protein [Sansalvadorimonas verongulae]